MLQNYNKWKVLQVFFDHPLAEGGWQLREISRKIRLAPPSIKNYLRELRKERLILQKKDRNGNPRYYARRDDDLFKFYRKLDIVQRIKYTGLLQELQEKCLPTAIILFGSTARGEDTETSDVDIYLGSKKVEINLEKFEKELRRKVNLLFEDDFHKLSKELKNNILNGIILYGYVKVF